MALPVPCTLLWKVTGGRREKSIFKIQLKDRIKPIVFMLKSRVMNLNNGKNIFLCQLWPQHGTKETEGNDVSSSHRLELNVKQSPEPLPNCPQSTPLFEEVLFKNTIKYKLPNPKACSSSTFPNTTPRLFSFFYRLPKPPSFASYKMSSCVIYSSFYAGNHHPRNATSAHCWGRVRGCTLVLMLLTC